MELQDIRLILSSASAVIESSVGTTQLQIPEGGLPAVVSADCEPFVLRPDAAVQLQKEAQPIPARDLLRQIGRQLHIATLGRWGQFAYAENVARQHGDGLRVTMLPLEPHYAGLPWELMYDDNTAGFVALQPNISLVRSLPQIDAIESLRHSGPVRILIGHAAPSDVGPLTVSEEVDSIVTGLQPLIATGAIEVFTLRAQLDQLEQTLSAQGPWHVYHHIGHGGFDAVRGGFLVLEDSRGLRVNIDAERFGRTLQSHAPLRLLVLSSCQTAAAGGNPGVLSTAEQLLRNAHVRALITMQFSISNWAAPLIARALYANLAASGSIEEALTAARHAVAQAQPPPEMGVSSMEWCTPVLFLNGPNGMLFERESIATATLQRGDGDSLVLTASIIGEAAECLDRIRQALSNLGAPTVHLEADGSLRARTGVLMVLGELGASEEITVAVRAEGSEIELLAKSRSLGKKLIRNPRNEQNLRSLAAQLGILLSS